MPKKNEADKDAAKLKRKLGALISKRRGDMSQRQLAKAINIPPSNLKYIEDGVNAPTADVYARIADILWPDIKSRKKADELFMAIRKAPPPDVSEAIINNQQMIDTIRAMNDLKLNDLQIAAIKELLESFSQENNKGDSNNG